MQFQSFNFPNRFIRHRNFEGEITQRGIGPSDDFNFTIVERSRGRVSLKATNVPGHFLRHSNFKIVLGKSAGSGDALFVRDSTFFLEQGLADSSGISLRSVNFPDRYVRHRNFKLFLEPRDSPNLAPDATFFRSVPLADPVLIPASD